MALIYLPSSPIQRTGSARRPCDLFLLLLYHQLHQCLGHEQPSRVDAWEAVWGVQLCLGLTYTQKWFDERSWWLILRVNLTGPQDAWILDNDTMALRGLHLLSVDL